MAKTNYTFAKRQRELAKKRKKEEKRSRVSTSTGDQPETDPVEPGAETGEEVSSDETGSEDTDAEPSSDA
jgi:hypothetical protein